MGQRSHRRAKLTIEGRRTIVRRVRQLGWTVARAAEAMDVSRATAHKWLARYDAEGLAGLEDRSSRPVRSPMRLSFTRQQAIISRRRARLEGPDRIGWALGEAPSTVHAVLARHHMPRLCDLDRATRTVVRYQRERPGELVHIDVKKQGRIPEGGGWRVHGRGAGGNPSGKRGLGYDFLHIAVDDRTRVAYAEAHPDERAETAAGFAARAADWYARRGIHIERVLTDNGACYRSRAFATTLAAHNIGHRRTRPYRPQTNGKAERFNLTLKHEWAYARAYTGNQQRLDALPAWLHHYNHHRGHTAHNGDPPMAGVNNLPGEYS